MSTPVLVAIAGVLVAAVGTGRQAGQCVRRPGTSLIACSVGMLAITVALLAEGLGFATGFGSWTFRIIQLSAQLVAPLVLAWGLVEVVARAAAVRFAARLVAAAVTVVAGVVLATDPLSVTGFTKAWPSASVYYQVLPHYALILVALLTGVGALAVLAVCATRGRRAPADGPLVIGVAAVTVTVLLLIALRFSLPGPAYPALGLVAAGVLWFGTARLQARAVRPVAAGQVQADQTDHAGVTGANRMAVASEAEGADGVKWSRGNKGERGSRGADDRGGRGDDRGGRRADDRDGRDGRRPGERGFRPADDELRDPLAWPPPRDDFGEPDFPPPGRAPGRRDDRGQPDWPSPERPSRERPSPERSSPERPSRERPSPERSSRERPSVGPRYQPGVPGSEPATGMFDASLPGLDIPLPSPPTAAQAKPGTDLALPVTPPHGLIAIYTLLEDKVADFDRAADEVAEQVRASEPDTLVYVIHTVPKAPMQRIFYEVYRDRAAYERHEKQPYVQRFVTARRPYVLATNVIELRLKYAKVSPLPQAEAQAAQAQAAQAQAQPPSSPGNLPAVRNGNGGRPSSSRPASPRPAAARPSGRPETPDYPSRDPGSRPRDPGSRPRDPGYPPRQPSYQPRDPSFGTQDPGYAPRDPGRAPRDPGYAPRDPGRAPRDPGYAPRDPGYAPRDPGYAPREPSYQSHDPGYPPREPRYTPRDPGDQDYPAYPSPGRGYPSHDRGYPPPDPDYPSRGRAPGRSGEPEWSREPDRSWGEPGASYDGPGDPYYDPRDFDEPARDSRPRPRDSRNGSPDSYDPPPAPRYDRI
jgi:quinol monooxygenase YgiN